MGVRSSTKAIGARSTVAGKRLQTAQLPPCKGPKLSCFSKSKQPDIEFIRILSDPNTSRHSHVFEVNIDKSAYALKIFRFYSIEQDIVGMNDLQRSLIPDGELLYHYDPFYAECRAYGRIQEQRNQKRQAAVPALGYLMLPAVLESNLEEKFQKFDWDRPSKESKKPRSRQQPLRAIVKQMVYGINRWDTKTARKMLQNLLELRQMGIYNVDITADNYVGNQLVDFSLALTEPSLILATKSRTESDGIKLDDLRGFDEMLEDEGLTQSPATPSAWDAHEYRKKLRQHKQLTEQMNH